MMSYVVQSVWTINFKQQIRRLQKFSARIMRNISYITKANNRTLNTNSEVKTVNDDK